MLSRLKPAAGLVEEDWAKVATLASNRKSGRRRDKRMGDFSFSRTDDFSPGVWTEQGRNCQGMSEIGKAKAFNREVREGVAKGEKEGKIRGRTKCASVYLLNGHSVGFRSAHAAKISRVA